MAGLIFSGFRSPAQTAEATEYEVKAAFLYNFAKFVDWPAVAGARADSPIVIGVLGENVFHQDLEKILRGKVIQSHPLQFRLLRSAAEATNCEILFISPSEKNHYDKILRNLEGASILTVGETDQFLEAGGIINFVIVGKNVRFQINNETAKKDRLVISSKLLSLAVPAR
jgi:hypothetical protein